MPQTVIGCFQYGWLCTIELYLYLGGLLSSQLADIVSFDSYASFMVSYLPLATNSLLHAEPFTIF